MRICFSIAGLFSCRQAFKFFKFSYFTSVRYFLKIVAGQPLSNGRKWKWSMREIVGTERNILGDQGNMGHNFWEHGNSVKVNFGDHLNSFLTNKKQLSIFKGNKGTCTPHPREALIFSERAKIPFSLSLRATHSLGTTTRQSLFVLCLWVFDIVRLCTSQLKSPTPDSRDMARD